MFQKGIAGIILFIISAQVYAQSISGYVKEKNSQETIPFANVWIKGTIQGVTADADGYFSIANPSGNTLCASSVGYISNEVSINKNSDAKTTIHLAKEVQVIDDVTINAKMPIAKVIFKRIQEHKKENRRQIRSVNNYKSVQNTTVYTAIDTSSIISRAFDNINDVSIEMENQTLRFSPVYLAEEAQRVEGENTEVVYSKKDGIFPRINQAIENYILRSVVVDLDFYKDQIFILERGFISPISSSAMLHYNLYFNDSTRVNDKKYYHFTYAPKNRYNSLFSGQFVVEEGSYAITEISAQIPKEANINFVNGFKGKVAYKQLPNGDWFYDKQSIDINMSLTLNKDTSQYDSERIDQVSSGNWLVNKSTIYSTSSNLDNIEGNQWKFQDEFSSSFVGDSTYRKVETLKENTYVKAADGVGGMALSSYLNVGKVDIGPVFDIYSTNKIEGNRITVPLRTSEKLWDNFYVGGFLGYGTKSEEFKYGTNIAFRPLPTDKVILRMSYSDDYNLLSQDKFLRFVKNNPNNKGNSNFIGALTSTERNPYIKEDKSFEMRFEYNAENDLHIEAAPYYTKTTQTPDVSFTKDGVSYNDYSNYGVLFNMRYAFGQKFDTYFFTRVYYSTPVPIVNFGVDIGQVKLHDGDIGDSGLYAHIRGSVQGRLILGQAFIVYMVNGGYLMGDAPYDILDQPVGSMSFGYSKYQYNLLHHASFAHNLYGNAHLHLNGGGMVLNKIPLIRELKLREIVSLKTHYGDLTNSYNGVFDLPTYYHNDPTVPYAEIGFGLTNIFKVLRVEYVRQLGGTYIDKSYTNKHGIFFRAEMSF
ncbi:DUF5686 and carboxypeptidase-like regulatory domain-containing protein [Saccharicrinis aurantiacus]|uniref:DUF5686 and carboxypeptidase-like regulatory domain-containing protein n=1 Tax=Saccharicrinis aurantiacus TaxID=1849719 RepID=UPI002492AE8A|nr:DUF5686 and carboxypeptidase-like regulatory domain-containing protein [Saccharicrinis aurantiacus]